MSESASFPAFSRRRLLLSGIVAIPAAAVLARMADRRPAWPPAADPAAEDFNGAYFC
jgi:hypothetical protein